jgi:hypothetical protein
MSSVDVDDALKKADHLANLFERKMMLAGVFRRSGAPFRPRIF